MQHQPEGLVAPESLAEARILRGLTARSAEEDVGCVVATKKPQTRQASEHRERRHDENPPGMPQREFPETLHGGEVYGTARRACRPDPALPSGCRTLWCVAMEHRDVHRRRLDERRARTERHTQAVVAILEVGWAKLEQQPFESGTG